MRIFVASILAMRNGITGFKEYMDASNFGGNTVAGHRYRAMGALINTGLWFTMLLLVFHAGLDDDEEKSYVGRSLRRTISDLTRGLSIFDLMDTAKTPVVALQRIPAAGEGI